MIAALASRAAAELPIEAAAEVLAIHLEAQGLDADDIGECLAPTGEYDHQGIRRDLEEVLQRKAFCHHIACEILLQNGRGAEEINAYLGHPMDPDHEQCLAIIGNTVLVR